MPQLVCAGAVALATAQREIAQNWIPDDDDDDDDLRIRRAGTIARAECVVIAPLSGRR
jgi:hypothetical protein